MKSSIAVIKSLLILAIVQTFSWSSAQAAPGWVNNVTITSVTHAIYSGEIVQIYVAQTIAPDCPSTASYVVRDASHLKPALALAMAALLAGRPVNLFVTGSCDATGNPNVLGITLL